MNNPFAQRAFAGPIFPLMISYLRIASLPVLALALLGCESAGPKRIDTATASMEETRAMVARGSGEVSMTVSAAEAIGEERLYSMYISG